MNLISAVKPNNLLSEKEKFFADPSYNPQFEYDQEFSLEELTKWGNPKFAIVSHSFTQLLRPGKEVLEVQEDFITEEYISEKIHEFNQKYQLTEPLQVNFSPNLVSRCTVSQKNIYFQLPIRYTKETFADLCRHELETHILRRLNHNAITWPETYIADQETSEFRTAEEGLATLHTYLYRQDKVLARTYVTYIGVYLAQHYSFSEMYQKLRLLGCSTQRAWNISVRNKRGITDTSKKIAFTKDIVYLEGVLKVWNWIVNQNNDPHDLYLGRLSLEQVSEYHSLIDKTTLRYPSFLEDMESYRKNIETIGAVNHFEQLAKEINL